MSQCFSPLQLHKDRVGRKDGKRAHVKKELTPVKHEKKDDTRKGFARGAKDHFRFQVAFINQFVPPPWVQCFGSLGTGFVAVRPGEERPLPAKACSVKADRPKSAPVIQEFTGDSDVDAEADASARMRQKSISMLSPEKRIPPDATLIIFINAPTAGVQNRNGRQIGGYKEFLDVAGKSMRWSAQRGDFKNRRIEAIIAHTNRGGRVFVGVRSAINGGDETRHFRVLGELSHIDGLQRARFLVEEGDDLLNEAGTRIFHTQITSACLNNGLKHGTGLRVARYPTMTLQANWCMACCYTPPKAVLHFKDLAASGVDAFTIQSEKVGRAEKVALTPPAIEDIKAGQKQVGKKTQKGKVSVEIKAPVKAQVSTKGKIPATAQVPDKAIVPVKTKGKKGKGRGRGKAKVQSEPKQVVVKKERGDNGDKVLSLPRSLLQEVKLEPIEKDHRHSPVDSTTEASAVTGAGMDDAAADGASAANDLASDVTTDASAPVTTCDATRSEVIEASDGNGVPVDSRGCEDSGVAVTNGAAAAELVSASAASAACGSSDAAARVSEPCRELSGSGVADDGDEVAATQLDDSGTQEGDPPDKLDAPANPQVNESGLFSGIKPVLDRWVSVFQR
eukprot:TRINITY_DN40946_c0_g2_i1.p1 TRINITY_DN40946_c0_g2~~TRINITY_DN40946_c0_g2_i1.p1  ORF type:complete len:619 (+),score=128.06 TRINITY_DN40946_c0_g2_i1:59-1915(+)